MSKLVMLKDFNRKEDIKCGIIIELIWIKDVNRKPMLIIFKCNKFS